MPSSLPDDDDGLGHLYRLAQPLDAQMREAFLRACAIELACACLYVGPEHWALHLGLDICELHSLVVNNSQYITQQMVTYCELHPTDEYQFGPVQLIYRQRPEVAAPGESAAQIVEHGADREGCVDRHPADLKFGARQCAPARLRTGAARESCCVRNAPRRRTARSTPRCADAVAAATGRGRHRSTSGQADRRCNRDRHPAALRNARVRG